MRTLVKILLVASFFVIAFIPIPPGYAWVIPVMVIFMLLLVWVYYQQLYGVSLEEAAGQLPEAEQVQYHMFCGNVTGYGSAQDMSRGRLLFTERNMIYVCRKGKSFETVFTLPIEDVREYSIAKLLSFRRGFIFSFSDEREKRFVVSRPEKREVEIKRALHWD